MKFIQKLDTRAIVAIGLLVVLVVGAFIFYTNKQVVVAPAPKEFDAKTVLEKILSETSGSSPFLALEGQMTKIMREYGLKSGFLIIDEAEKENIITNDQCHALLHYVGHEGYAQNPYEYDKLTSLVEGTSCIGGFIHGIEAEIVLTSDNVREDLWNFCSYAKDKGVDPGSCFHGAGHAASELYNYDIPKSLALCDSLAGGPEPDMTNCYRGVFSQLGNVIIGVDGHTGLAIDSIGIEGLDAEAPFLYCQKLDAKYQSSCKSQLLKLLIQGLGPEEWLNVCVDPAFDMNSQELCINIHAGIYVRELLSFKESVTFPEYLYDYPSNLRQIAILGGLEAFSGYFTDNTNKKWEVLCDAFPEKADVEYCYEVFELHLNTGAAPWMDRSDLR